MRALVALFVCAIAFAPVQPPPQRIVSLVPAVTEMLFALGAGRRVVGVSSVDRFPTEVASLPKVGALMDPDVERMIALRPDLVVVYHSQTDLRSQLARAGIPAFVYTHAGLADVFETLRAIGARVGRPEEAMRLAGRIKGEIDAVRRAVGNRPRPRTLVVFGRESFALRSIYASGGIGFVHDMLTAAGGDNVFADVKRESVQATTELILARRPDVILELRVEPMTKEQERKELELWGQLRSVPAVKNGRVHLLVDARTVIPGPRIAEGLELIADRLHHGGEQDSHHFFPVFLHRPMKW